MSKLTSDYCFKSEIPAPTEIISRSLNVRPCTRNPAQSVNFRRLRAALTWTRDLLPTSYLKWKWLFLTVSLYLGFAFENRRLLTFSLAQVFLGKIWKNPMVFRGHRLLLPWIWHTLFQSSSRDIGCYSSDSTDCHFRSYLEKKKVNPEAWFAGSQRVFKHSAQTADPASGYINKNDSAFGSLSYFVP